MLDLKLFGRSLADAGLMGKSFASMSEKEVRVVVGMVLAFSKKPCIHCDQWEKVPDAPWWVGTCRLDGHSIDKSSHCTLTTDEPPF